MAKPRKQEKMEKEITQAEEEYRQAGKETVEEDKDKKERIEILKNFTKEVLKKYGNIVRAVVLFGSTARQTFRKESDIDVFVILDDTRTRISPAFRAEIEDALEEIAKKTGPQLSVQQPYMLTEFWRLVREGHPIIFNFIREGIPVYDRDIFLPIKRLLQMGEIKPSKEAVEKFIERGPSRIKRVENAKIYMVVEDCYYAMLESAQAVLMFLGKAPPRPADAPREMDRHLVEPKFLNQKFVDYLREVIEVRKEVEHKRKNSMSGIELDKWIARTKEFVKEMQKLIVRIEVLKRENMVLKSKAIMEETTVTLLKAMDMQPKKDESLQQVFERELVTPGHVDKYYLNVLGRLMEMESAVKEGKVMDIPKSEILTHREYVRKFIREAGRVMRKKAKVSPEGL